MIKKILHRISSISNVKFYYQRSITNYNKREKIANRIAKKIGVSSFEGDSILPNSKIENTLSTKGYINFGKVLSESEINNITEQLVPLKCFDPFRPELKDFTFSNIPNEVHVANYKRADLVQIPEITKIANDPKILTLAQEFLGATPTISNVNCWWSTSTNDEAEQAQFFHRDVDDYRFCKVFIYLSDVEMENGPHVFVEDSPASNTLTAIRRYQDHEIESAFGKYNIKYFTAPKGSMFMVNTYGFHKGLLPKKGKRLLLQIQYSLQPIGIEKYNPINGYNNSYNKHTNRLILKQ
ncbi:hypothetical protein MWU58_03215 [Flavobacteriaceae bacterium S0825]|uniref:hypothetical protein n=1 Tax=Gaetbulibacter sp. S0825 TaxID=2720084 RepID=UPI001430F585|nr:hypothetical protein [Gaetbulibacter sp. S0825]MCK0108288.1 hypothetical protein [Flavobacteriaceae bacterium S0825]NIX63924.1 hypothetical protein [Gaetbulibacter sp. S0825]